MKKLILLLVILIQACSPNKDATPQTTQALSPVQIASKTMNGTYNYSEIRCFDKTLGGLTKQIRNNYYEEITISDNNFSAKIGYIGNPNYITTSGSVTNINGTLSLGNIRIESTTNNSWIYFAQYKTGILSYPDFKSVIEIGSSANLQNIDFGNIIIGSQDDFYVFVDSSKNLSFGALQDEKCFMFYDKDANSNMLRVL